MSAYQSASQRASRQAAAELAVDDGDIPFHHSREVPRLALGADDEALLALAGPVRPREGGAALRPPPSLSTTAIASSAALPSTAEVNGAGLEGKQGGSPFSHGSPSHQTSQDITRNASVSGVLGGSLHTSGAGGMSASQRHLERMAQPRDANGVPFEPSQPNYGQVLSLTEEEERDRRRAEQLMQATKSPRTPRTPRTPRASVSTPRVADRPQSLSSTTVSHASPAAKSRPLSAAQLARLEKLAAPKRHPEPEAEPERASHPRTASAAAGGPGSSAIFDRLSAAKKPATASLEETPPSSPYTPRQRYGPTHTPVATQPSEEVLQRLSRPKGKPESHTDANGMVEYNPYGPVKRYYGGTTVISGASHAPAPRTAGQGHSRIPNATWDAVDRSVLARSAPPPSLPSVERGACAECRHAVPQQTVEVVAHPVSVPAAAQAPQPRPLPAVKPIAATTSAAAVQVSVPTVVQSAPAKTTGTRPPVVVRTRRYVPPSEEAEAAAETAEVQRPQEAAVAAPQPVEATRRRTTSASAPRNSPPPESPVPAVAVPAAAPVTTSGPASTPAKESSPSPSPAHITAVTHAVKPVPPSVAEPAPRAVVQATRRRSSSNSAPAAPSDPLTEAATSPSPVAPPAAAPAVAAHPAAAPLGSTPVPAPPASEPVPTPAPAPVVVARHPVPAAVQATRRAPPPTTTPAQADTPAPAPAPKQEKASAQAKAQAKAQAPAKVQSPAPAPAPAGAPAPAQPPAQGVVQATKRTPRQPSPPAPAAAPVASTATLTPALPSVAAPSPSPPAASEGADSDKEEEEEEKEKASHNDATQAVDEVAKVEGGNAVVEEDEEEQLWRVAPPTPKSASVPAARPTTSVYDRLAPPPLPAEKLMAIRHSHKKKCVRPPKPEVLKDEDFACQLEDCSPEPRRPIVIKKKSKATRKKAAAAKTR